MSIAKILATDGLGAMKKGVSYVSKEARVAITQHTAIGRRLSEGVHSAREAVHTQIEKLQSATGSITERYKKALILRGNKIAYKLVSDPEFVALYNKYADKTGIKHLTLQGKTDAQFFQEMIEKSGVGPTKLAQIKSNDPEFMSSLDKYPELKEAIANTKSGCSFSRTVEEAQKVIDDSFPERGIKITKELKAGSIGAAYIVERKDGSKAIVKMLKKGVDEEQLNLEEQIMKRIIPELEDSPETAAKTTKMMENLYRDWRKELNFGEEMANNKALAAGAKRYKVADIKNISKDGRCIIMDMAHGIQMDKLVKMLQDYKAKPMEFATKYAKEIKANPWLSDPEKVMKQLPEVLTKTFDEQFMFMKEGGKSIMHGDPHTGNFFITTDEKGKLIPEFIDTGNCVQRTGEQIKSDINFFTNYFVGNSEGVAKYFINQCGYKGTDKAEVTKKIAQDIQNQIFGQKHDITKFADVQANIQVILEKYGLKMSTENATAMKAQMQFFSAISEAGKLSGQSFNMMTILKDVPQASWNMIKQGTNPFKALKDAFKFAYHNQQQAMGTAYQFTISDVEKGLGLELKA
ncbi:MAG: AarF/UbiB family protein [Cyanobacteriota bacterium]|nr:AarF/UbiB family protein [Cyanobacteriota bacterium]